MELLRKIVFPLSLIYSWIAAFRNFMYDKGWFTSEKYSFPVICVGNLSVGGTGKTPMIEYLIRLLQDRLKLATLSRGYKRKTSGFILANEETLVTDVGDEPFQYVTKFKKAIVAVDANRQRGIANLLSLANSPDAILLDDAFQHRKVTAGFNILLTVYQDLYIDDYLLPTGNLRDNRREARRADIIVVTKCPPNLSTEDKEDITRRLKLKSSQHLFFTSIVYDNKFYSNDKVCTLDELKDKTFSLVTGIANPKHLTTFLKKQGLNFEHLKFQDHHHFSKNELETLNKKELILTTEKDYMRFRYDVKNAYYLPIEIGFLFDGKQLFDKMILDFIEKKKAE